MMSETPTAQERKKVLRRHVLQKRRSCREQLPQISAVITERLLATSVWQKAKVVMAYLAMPDEVNLDALVAAGLRAGKIVCVPVLAKEPGVMHAVRLHSLADVCPRVMGIREPADVTARVAPETIDLVLVPGAAFQKNGARLGMGAGYYDRFLPQTKALRIGICAEISIQETIPVTEHDCMMDYVMTERACYPSDGNGAEGRKSFARK